MQSFPKSREIAIEFQQTLEIKRTEIGWVILVSEEVYEIISRKNNLDIEEEIDCEDDIYESVDPHEDERKLLNEEMAGDQESWSRSEEDGWYYED